jgi:DNA polymerase-3 subunit delta'
MDLTRKNAFEYLSRAHADGRLAHAYLISGPRGSGKRALTSDLCALVTGTAVADVFTTQPPDVYLAEPESKARKIKIEQVRALEHALQMRASAGGRKVAIIAEADRLQPQAANAFLKTLEEPPRDSLLLLLTSMPEALQDTILSRCSAMPLVLEEKQELSAEERELVKLLGTIGKPGATGIQYPYRLARGFHQLVGQIRESIQETNEAARKREEMRYKETTDGAWLDEREDYYKALSESQYLLQRSRLIETLLVWWSDVLRANTGFDRRDLPSAAQQTQMVGQKLSTSEILRCLRRLEELRDHLGRNIQETLAIEVAFLSVFTF